MGFLRSTLIAIHRWLGVALSLLLTLWFASGIVMMYRGFPSVEPLDRLARAPTLDPARIARSAGDVFSAPGRTPPLALRLSSFDGRPVYQGPGTIIYADEGTELGAVNEALIERAAAAWAGRPVHEAVRTLVREADQWTVGGELRGLLPLHKFAWPDGQQVYVHGASADVVQYTTRASRFWAYLGAIPHWLYFTPLRTHFRWWYPAVVWTSMLGTVAALLGVAVALWVYSPRRRYRAGGRPASIPYRGWKRWHMIAGLVFGVVAVTWTFSGLLSMGPFPITDRLAALVVSPEEAARGSGVDLAAGLLGPMRPLEEYAARPAGDAIAAVPGFEVKELEYASYGGEPLYVATDGRGDTRIIPVAGAPRAAFDADELMRRLREAAGGTLAELRVLDAYDAYYLDRSGRRPLPVVYLRLRDPGATRYYIDPKTASVVETYNSGEWVERWLYHGLHSVSLPWLYTSRPLWDIVVIGLLLGGTALCATSVALTVRLIGRKLAALRRRGSRPPEEDLALGGPGQDNREVRHAGTEGPP